MMQQGLGHSLDRSAKCQNNRGIFWNGRRHCRTDGSLACRIQFAPPLIGDIDQPLPRHCPAMNAIQKAEIGQIAQIAADRLHGNAEMPGQIFGHDLPHGAGKRKDFTLARGQGHACSLTWCDRVGKIGECSFIS